MCLKNRLRRQFNRDSDLTAEVNRLQRSVTRRLKEWRNDQRSATLESLDPEYQSLWRVTKRVMRVPIPSPPWSHRGIALSDSVKPEVLADSLENTFQPVTDFSVSVFIEKVDMALRSYILAPVSEPKLTKHDDFHEAIRGINVRKALEPNGIPNRALKRLP